VNPVQIVEAARPEVGTMPPIDRRHLRERIFDAAIRAQSELSPVDLASPNNRASNAARLAALALLGVVAIGGLAYSASRDTPGSRATAPSPTDPVPSPTVEPTVNTVAQVPRPTAAPTTTMPPIPGSGDTPLLLPPERNRLDELTVVRAPLGGSALLLRAPDLSTISLVEVDGLAPAEPEEPEDDPSESSTTTTVPPRQYASVSVIPPDEDTPGQYSLEVACGSVAVLDTAGRPAFRPEVDALFNSMRITDGVIDIELPDGWAAISGGPSTDEFAFGLPVEIGDQRVTIMVAQYPGGSLAVAGNDQRQYGPATFNGQPAWIHRDPEDPDAFTILATVGTTAIRVSARDISLAETEVVINSLTPGDVDEWTNRFGTLPVELDPDIRACSDQPEFNIVER
jgi:hypothetical protein